MGGSWQTIVETSIGVAVARTQLGAAIQKPSQAQELVEFVPYMSQSGVPTTAQSQSAELELNSDSINLLPKRVIVPPIMAGLSTLIPSLIPILMAYAAHTPVKEGSTSTVSAFGTAQVASTVAPLMGVGLKYSTDRGREVEMFYDKPANETATGTAATTVTGNTIQINDGKMLMSAYFAAVYTTPVAGDPIVGQFGIASNNFDDSMGLDMPMQPVGAFLGATAGTFLPKLTAYHNLVKGMKSSCLITTSARFGVAIGTTGSFIHGVGYHKIPGT